jgi:predicted AAA+ superfamily ATPase
MIFHRNIAPRLEAALARSPAVLLTGPRQSGKTTLMKELVQKKGYAYVTFDEPGQLNAAKNDPLGFIKGLPKPVILDEVQYVPEVFLPIKLVIDENRTPGMFALTGSANPLLIPRLGDALVGRLEILNLFPLSQGELRGKTENFVERVFSEQLPEAGAVESKVEIIARLMVGGYPLVQGVSDQDREAWFASYIMTILQRDVSTLAHIEGLHNLPHLLQLLATRAGGLLNTAELARTSGIANTTMHRYLALLHTTFLIQFQQAWSANLGKQLVKSPKVYFLDSGLLCHLLGVGVARLMGDDRLMGAAFENFVVSEIGKQLSWSALHVKSFHYRTQAGSEVDLILEAADGRIVGIEIKRGESIKADAAKGLVSLQASLGDRFVRGIVLYMGTSVIPFAERIHALPVSSLWA